jgi:hypothetical protein
METNQLTVLVAESGLPAEAQDTLTTQFADFFAQVASWSDKAKELVITSEEQKQEMKQAREGRLFLKALRGKVESTRKELKEDSLKQGRAIDLIASQLKGAIEPIETYLQEQETFAVRAAAERKEALRAERYEALLPYTADPKVFALGDMDATTFDELYASLKLATEQRAEQARLAEQQRQADEAAAAERQREQQQREAERQRREAAEVEAQRQENERLRAQAAERERVLAAERAETARKQQQFEAAAAQARRDLEARQREAEAEATRQREAAEQLRREQAEREAQAVREREAAAAAEAERLRRLAAAPDREKLLALIDTLNAVELPALATPEAQQITAGVQTLLAKVNAYIRDKAEQL